MAHDSDHDNDNDVPESTGIGAIRCPDCGMIHVALLDKDENPLVEMTLDDTDVIGIAMQLLHAVFPNMQTHALMERINAVTNHPHTRRH